jgi:hypothetical protein
VELTGTGLVLTLRKQPVFEAPRLQIVPVGSQGMAPRDIFLAHLANAHVHMWGSVAPTSRQTYSLGWARWREFVAVIGTDVAMSVVPPGIAVALDGLSWPEACVIAFLSFLRDGEGVNMEWLSPQRPSITSAGRGSF